MPASKAQQKAVSKYMKENYDVYQIRMKKGQKDIIKAHAETQGESVNGFINRAIDHQISQDRDGGSQEDAGGKLVGLCEDAGPDTTRFQRLPTGTLEAAFTAAKSVGERPADFIVQAIMERVGTTGGPSEAQQGPSGGGGISLHPEALQTAQEAAQKAGETVSQFVERAVSTQAQRDETARKLEGGK